jgi:hypothetical protein
MKKTGASTMPCSEKRSNLRKSGMMPHAKRRRLSHDPWPLGSARSTPNCCSALSVAAISPGVLLRQSAA